MARGRANQPVASPFRVPLPRQIHSYQRPKNNAEDQLRRPASVFASIARTGIAALGIAIMLLFSGPSVAEDELRSFANGQFKKELVSSECFATSCKAATQSCIDDVDCKKGLMCIARCLGDSSCITGSVLFISHFCKSYSA